MQAKKLLAPETQSYVKIKLNLWIKLSFYQTNKILQNFLQIVKKFAEKLQTFCKKILNPL